ncbi:hypothetical protein M413DRAFT_448272 [Hebeloma cylindrosporum]|uniref:Uncharacterized protein n=1 Tax=Hebeloma cylindrosporum TaxID=76867 RepID=A0A0C2Y9Q6_HEBCY|nr:hypothetical protein M413DRAFT_448272 [Hebeloma cylindrosporum h7]
MLASWTTFLLRFIPQIYQDAQLPSSCLQQSQTIQGLATCLDKFTIPHDTYAPWTYALAQPTANQRKDWKLTVKSLLEVDGNCSATLPPLSLRGLYDIEPFKDYCVLYETSTQCGTYLKGWGFMVVPAFRGAVSRSVHVSAPHPGYDLGTVEQAASVFETTGSKSLLVPGRTRTAFLESSDCIVPVSSKQDYYMTDPAHNDLEPFFDASVSIYDWQQEQGGCPSSTCAFVQFHGKGPSTCASDDVFLSSGIGNSPASKTWYSDPTDRPIKRFQQNLQHAFPSWNINLPSDSNCPLTATKNVVGRHLNGIQVHNVCSKGATSRMATGEFVHAEQASLARDTRFYDGWSQAMIDTFDATCVDGMVVDPKTKMCMGVLGSNAKPQEDVHDHNHQVVNRRMDGMDGPTQNQWYTFLSSFILF